MEREGKYEVVMMEVAYNIYRNNKQQAIAQHALALAIYVGNDAASKRAFALHQQFTTLFTPSAEVSMPPAFQFPGTPICPPTVSDYLRSGAIHQDGPLLETPAMQPIATGYIAPAVIADPKDALIDMIVDHLRRQSLTHLQVLALGIIADFALAVRPQEIAETESMEAVAERNAQIEAAVAAAAEGARTEGAGTGENDTINTALLGSVQLGACAKVLLPAFQPQQTPKAAVGEAGNQQTSPARFPIRKLKLRMPPAKVEEEEPATPQEEQPVQQIEYQEVETFRRATRILDRFEASFESRRHHQDRFQLQPR